MTRDEVCVVACADAWRGDGEVLASAFGFIPTIGARLAKATFEPNLIVSDGEATLVANDLPLGGTEKVVAGWLPFRDVFALVANGKRHVMMGASQIDAHGNQNISCVGDWHRPTRQLIGVRGGPGNTVNHTTSYWVPNHSTRVFVERVDMVSGVGWDRGAYEIRRVVTNLGVFDFDTRDHSMRVRSLHPGATLDEVMKNTGFPLVIPEDIPESRLPTEEEVRLIREVFDPKSVRKTEVKA